MTRYLPLAETNSEDGNIDTTAYYLTSAGSLYKCTNTLNGETVSVGVAENVSGYSHLKDIYMLDDNTMYIDNEDEGNMIKFQIGKQLVSAERNMEYRIYVGAKNPQAWFAADPTINGVGKANQTTLEGNSIYLSSTTNAFGKGLTSGIEISDFALSGTQMIYSTPYGAVYASS